MNNPVRFNKKVNLSKEDPLNLPRHKANGYCSDFEECPLCYKCRAFNHALYKCRNCEVYQEGSLCKKELHTPEIIGKMIIRERIDVDEKNK